ncbi:PREDICTED: sorting nexin-4-like [Nicrophorus vespilloides]|uniref:Sorting nexin-4-like n=1 Tax=Nicrophorus vespilloides TaxID=110193 RepID=A0ABM1MC15_NICVS|nr:PREDICTED: sorting nexin-4-like [Nicrophorus vespilloides]
MWNALNVRRIRRAMAENGNRKKIYGESKERKEDILLQHAEIAVSESEKRANGSLNLREFYTVYLIETKATDPEFQNKISKLDTVWRRYTEFEQLRDYLEVTYPYVVLPPLPEKRVMFGWQKLSTDTFDPDFIDRRRAGLENFLLRVAAHTVLSWDKNFMEFLQHEDGWRESYKANGYLQIAESKLKALNVSVRLKNTDSKFDSLKVYSGTFHTNIYNLLKARSRVAEKQYNVYKLHANYGRVFSEWSAIEKDMGDALQKTGHYLDSLASSIDASLEDEELLVDQFKEYLFFANSLSSVCKHREMLQYEVETSEESVASKNVERVKAQQGKLGMMSRLFGAVDTDEVRELKVNMLDQQIQEGETVVNSANVKLSTFTDNAIKDIDRFQSQKVSDLKDTLASFVLLQLKTAKRGLQTWVQIRDCLQNIP